MLRANVVEAVVTPAHRHRYKENSQKRMSRRARYLNFLQTPQKRSHTNTHTRAHMLLRPSITSPTSPLTVSPKIGKNAFRTDRGISQRNATTPTPRATCTPPKALLQFHIFEISKGPPQFSKYTRRMRRTNTHVTKTYTPHA